MTFQSVSSLPDVLRRRIGVSAASIAEFCQRWRVEELSLFGSIVREDFTDQSDVDVLVVFTPERHGNWHNRTHMQTELSRLFGRPVDLTEKRLIKNPISRREILRSHKIIYPLSRANFTQLAPANRTMTNEIRNQAALLDTVNAMEAIQLFLQGKAFEDYCKDMLLRSGVERQIEVLGEAANRLTDDFQAAHSDVDWGSVVGLRNVIIHQYDDVDSEKIWAIATESVPSLLTQIQSF